MGFTVLPRELGAEIGMLVVETIAKIRRAHFVDGKPIKQICRELKLSRKVVLEFLGSSVDTGLAGPQVPDGSAAAYRERYGADPSIVGRQLALNDTPYLIVGVMPPKFHYPDDVDVWQRLRWDLTQHSRAAHFMEAVARLAPGTSIDQAQRAVDTLALRLQTEFAGTNTGWGTRIVPLLDEQLGYYRPALMVLFGAVALLLVIVVARDWWLRRRGWIR